MSVHREGRAVHIVLTAEDEYRSIALYETLVNGAKAGCLNLKAAVADGGQASD